MKNSDIRSGVTDALARKNKFSGIIRGRLSMDDD